MKSRWMVGLLLVGGFGLGALLAWAGGGEAPPVSRPAPTPVNGDQAPSSVTADATALHLARGAELYQLHCASCHGADGEGQPNWKVAGEDGSLPAPPHDASGHTWHHADAQLLEIIARGGTVYMPESQMPAFEGILTADEMRATLDHIKRWWGPEELRFQAEISASWTPPPSPNPD